MEYVIFAAFIIIALAGLVSLIFGLPGTLIILGGSVLFAWYDSFQDITMKVIIILVALVILGELLEFVLGIAGAKKRKASRKAIIGSIIGSIVGAIFLAPLFFGIGAILGAFAGAFAGAFLVELLTERKGMNQAIQSGYGALLGKVGGTISKGAIGIAMIVITIVAAVNN